MSLFMDRVNSMRGTSVSPNSLPPGSSEESTAERSKSWKMSCKLIGDSIFLILVLFSFIFLWGDPLLKDSTTVQLLHKKVDVYRARDPLNLQMKGSDCPVKVFEKFSAITGDSALKEVYTYILGYFLRTDATGRDRQSALMTPLQASMLMMGCYGYPHDVQGSTSSIRSLLQQSWIDHESINPFAMNFLLQALEDSRENNAYSLNDLQMAMLNNNISQLAQTARLSNDKSACSCLKDFANPSLFHLGDLKLNDNTDRMMQNAAEDVTCENRKYMHDPCSVQRVLDYALDGAPETNIQTPAVVLTNATLRNMLLTNTVEVTGATRRHIFDPLFQTLSGRTGQISSEMANFLKSYCDLAPARCTTVGLVGPFETMQYSTAYTHLKNLVKFIKPHNKLRPPQMCANDKQCTQVERGEGKVSQATYEAYIHKYRMAFQTCARDGVPQYVRSKLNTVTTAGVYSLAEAWLLLAAVFAWTWAYYVHYRLKQTEVGAELVQWRLGVGAVVVATAYVMLLIKLAQFYEDLYRKVSQDEQKTSIADEAAGLFTFLWWIFAVLLFVVFGWLGLFKFVKENDVMQMMGCGRRRAKVSPEAKVDLVFPVKPVEGVVSSGGQPIAEASYMQSYLHRQPFNTGVTFMTPQQRQEVNANAKRASDTIDMQLIATLQRVVAPAQVAQDLSVISGLTTLAIACVTQRGLSDVNVITTVSVWFFSIGLIAHLSNIMRLAHVYAQFHQTAGTDKHMRIVPFTRTGIAIGLGVMLFVFLRLAGLDGVLGSPHAEQHQLIFAILALVMLCGADVVDAVLAPTPENTHAETRTVYFWTHVSSKSYYMGWLVLLSLFVLHNHRSGAVCRELGATHIKGDFGAACYFAGSLK